MSFVQQGRRLFNHWKMSLFTSINYIYRLIESLKAIEALKQRLCSAIKYVDETIILLRVSCFSNKVLEQVVTVKLWSDNKIKLYFAKLITFLHFFLQLRTKTRLKFYNSLRIYEI